MAESGGEVQQLMKTVFFGNGQPPLVTEVPAIKGEVRSMKAVVDTVPAIKSDVQTMKETVEIMKKIGIGILLAAIGMLFTVVGDIVFYHLK